MGKITEYLNEVRALCTLVSQSFGVHLFPKACKALAILFYFYVMFFIILFYFILLFYFEREGMHERGEGWREKQAPC